MPRRRKSAFFPVKFLRETEMTREPRGEYDESNASYIVSSAHCKIAALRCSREIFVRPQRGAAWNVSKGRRSSNEAGLHPEGGHFGRGKSHDRRRATDVSDATEHNANTPGAEVLPDFHVSDILHSIPPLDKAIG